MRDPVYLLSETLKMKQLSFFPDDWLSFGFWCNVYDIMERQWLLWVTLFDSHCLLAITGWQWMDLCANSWLGVAQCHPRVCMYEGASCVCFQKDFQAMDRIASTEFMDMNCSHKSKKCLFVVSYFTKYCVDMSLFEFLAIITIECVMY